MGERQHYISKFHLSGFIDPASVDSPDPWLWTGDLEQLAVKRRSPDNVAWGRNLFDGPGAFADDDLDLERFLAEEVEGPAAAALRDWIGREPGSRGEIPAALFRYLAWAAARSLPMEELFEEWLNSSPLDVRYVEEPLPGYEKIKWLDEGLCMEHPTLGIRDDVRRNEVDVLRRDGWLCRLRRKDFSGVVHQQAWYFATRFFPSLRWAVLDAPAGAYFVIGDRPVLWGVAELTNTGSSIRTRIPPLWLRHPHIQLVAPLTHSVALVAWHSSAPTPDAVKPRAINAVSASGAYRFLFGPTEHVVADVLEARRRA